MEHAIVRTTCCQTFLSNTKPSHPGNYCIEIPLKFFKKAESQI